MKRRNVREEKGATAARTAVLRTLGLAMLLGMTMGAATPQNSTGGRPTPLDGGAGQSPTSAIDTAGNPDPTAKIRAEGQARNMANDRQRRLVADAERLVELSNELKVEVGKSTKDDLSVTVVRRAAEIEKIAHDLKERERN